MLDSHSDSLVLRRPALLVRAARHGVRGYDRRRSLPRLLRTDSTPEPGRALPALLRLEAECEAARAAGIAGYVPSRHVELLIAVFAEAGVAPLPATEAGLTVR